MICKEINKTGIFVAVIAILCYIRNVFFPQLIIPRYSLYPYRMNGNLIRCSNACFSGKTSNKSLHRLMFFNLLRVTMHEIIKELVLMGKVKVWEVGFVTCCCFVWTLVFYYMPLRVWRYFRFVWGWLLMEYYTKHSADLINNRNELENLGSHNFIAFFIFLYLESNSTCTPAMLEGLLYGEHGILDLPFVVYDFAFNYFIAVPLIYILQIFVMGASLKFYIPTSLYSAYFHNTHIDGYLLVNEVNGDQYDKHWLFCAINAAVFIGLSSIFDVYKRIKFLEDYEEEEVQEEEDPIAALIREEDEAKKKIKQGRVKAQ